jgi:3-dehydroquinate synthetase
MKRTQISVKSAAGAYSIVCGSGLLRRASDEMAALGTFSSVHMISSPNVWRALGKTLKTAFKSKAAAIHLMDDAESAKHLRTVENLSRSLIRAGADRKSLIVTVGGGVVGDVGEAWHSSTSQRRWLRRSIAPSAEKLASIYQKGRTLSARSIRRDWC